MVRGIGIDIIEIERIRESIHRAGSRFLDKIYTPTEIAYCNAKAYRYQHYAARFAAKEAFLKATGTGWINGTAFNEIEILPDEKGKPVLNLLGETAATFQPLQIKKIFVSLSHLKSIASAVVVIEN